MLLAGVSQLLSLIDPVIFGKIIDEYALNPNHKPENELVRGVLLVARDSYRSSDGSKAYQSYSRIIILKLTVQKFGMQIFNDGLKQTLRLSYEEFEEQRSGETFPFLQKTRRDTESFITLLSISCFLLW